MLAPHYLDYCSFVGSSEIGKESPPNMGFGLFFFIFKIILAILSQNDLGSAGVLIGIGLNL